MKLILIQDTVLANGYTGFLDEHPALIIAVDKPENAHEAMKAVAQIFLDMALKQGDMAMGKAMLGVKETNNFELVIYDIPKQYELIKSKVPPIVTSK